ncbi:peptidoglycan-binding protein [Loktanella agnita]|uniref:peptidoglycan-binding domain-containing protein n=1 Tax=Loktanella agnita TaxID=287097 RepID=UPI00398627D3
MRLFPLIASLSGLALPAVADDAALLIGVERYQELRRASNGTDVLAGAEALRGAGYAVSTLANGGSADMRRLVQRFAAEAADANRLVVGLSGRFVTDGSRTWLLAANADEPSLFDTREMLSVDSLMQILARTPGQAVLVLGYDQGADDNLNTYLRQGVGDLEIPQGVTVLYGEANVSDDVISDALTEPGENVIGFANDARWLQVAGYQPRVLVMQSEEAQGDAAPVVVPPIDSTYPLWMRAQEVDTADAYRGFLFDYPDSPYADQARDRLDAIENNPQRLAEQTEDELNLTSTQRRGIQQDLTLLDYNTRGVDGIFGPGSRTAIRNWQQENGYTQTSFLTREQILRLDAQASRRATEIEAEEERERAEQERLDRAFWDETGARGDEAGYRAYLDRYPEGMFSEEASQKLSEMSNADAAADEEALNINPVLARLIESRLSQLGYGPGRVDGRFDANTRQAISRYQADRNLPATGYLNQPTLARLLTDTFGR